MFLAMSCVNGSGSRLNGACSHGGQHHVATQDATRPAVAEKKMVHRRQIDGDNAGISPSAPTIRLPGASTSPLSFRKDGEPLRVYSAGQSWTEPPNAHHLVSANASKTRPARLIAYIIADDGAQPTVYDK
jgi:hypothetical protein